MFGKKKSEAMDGKPSRTIIREKLERIVIRTRGTSQVGYCSSCGRATTWLTSEQAQEIFESVSSPVESIHLTEDGTARLICAESIAGRDEEQNEKE